MPDSTVGAARRLWRWYVAGLSEQPSCFRSFTVGGTVLLFVIPFELLILWIGAK